MRKVFITIALLFMGCESKIEEEIVWKYQKNGLPIGLVIRVEDLIEDIQVHNPKVLEENFNPEHLAYDNADDIYEYNRYFLESVCYDDKHSLYKIKKKSNYTYETMYKKLKKPKVLSIEKESRIKYTLYHVFINFMIDEYSITCELPIKEELNKNKNLRINYSILPDAVG